MTLYAACGCAVWRLAGRQPHSDTEAHGALSYWWMKGLEAGYPRSAFNAFIRPRCPFTFTNGCMHLKERRKLLCLRRYLIYSGIRINSGAFGSKWPLRIQAQRLFLHGCVFFFCGFLS